MELKATSPAQSLGQLVPDDDHGYAAGKADHDKADHVLRLVS
jgi:hypothetical protein